MCSNHIIIKAVKSTKEICFLYVSAHYYVTIAIVSKVQALKIILVFFYSDATYRIKQNKYKNLHNAFNDNHI